MRMGMADGVGGVCAPAPDASLATHLAAHGPKTVPSRLDPALVINYCPTSQVENSLCSGVFVSMRHDMHSPNSALLRCASATSRTSQASMQQHLACTCVAERCALICIHYFPFRLHAVGKQPPCFWAEGQDSHGRTREPLKSRRLAALNRPAYDQSIPRERVYLRVQNLCSILVHGTRERREK